MQQMYNNCSCGNYTKNFYAYNALYSTCNYGDNVLLYAKLGSRSKTLLKGVANTASLQNMHFGYRHKTLSKGFKFEKAFKAVRMGLDWFHTAVITNKLVGSRFLITTAETLEEDFYNHLRNNYEVAILKEWTPAIRDRLICERLVLAQTGSWQGKVEYKNFSEGEGTTINLHGKEVLLRDVFVYDFQNLKQENYEQALIELGDEGLIKIADVPSQKLDVADLNHYIEMFGRKGALKIKESMNPLVPEESQYKLDSMVMKESRLFDQQIAAVKGMMALKDYGIMCEEMGCGKTKQAMAVVLGRENEKAMRLNGISDLKEMYARGIRPNFRTIIMCPPHLCKMWVRDIEKEIPFAKARIISSVEDLMKIQKAGKERNGAEFFVISKETAKMDTQKSPIPSKAVHMVPKAAICKDCYEENSDYVYKGKNGTKERCSKCGGRNWMTVPMTNYGKQYGMVCPSCGELLIQWSSSYYNLDDEYKLTLKPKDFSSHKDSNDKCYLCDAPLWGVDVKPVGVPEGKDLKKAWYKVSHFKNHQKKSRVTGFVLKNHEKEYYDSVLAPAEGRRVMETTYGPRKTALAQYIKKHMKGFFDYCILDEAHKYEGAGTAQAMAAQALIKASKFTLCLTGTISNGKADSLFYLLYMLCPRKMKKHNFDFGDVMSFADEYGSIERSYESSVELDGKRNASSRGKQVGSAKIKPGISPILQLDFLLDHTIFLSISDMASFLPPLNEYVVTSRLPKEAQDGYNQFMGNMQAVLNGKGGRSYLAAWLQTSMAYPSKPYGHPDIMSTWEEDVVMCNVPSFDEYADLETHLPKEDALIEKVQAEIEEGRNCFIYCSFTGDTAKNCMPRLKALIEKYCNLEGKVLIMEAGKPEAVKREAYIHEKAAEGYKVIICNQKLVETGLDFCFKHEGVEYNYPTIMVYQITYELAVQMQSTHRHYRLNQKQECRTYYFVTEGTAEMAALSIMADKQVAAAALQGNFNTEGLAAMASGVDDKVKLVQMLKEGDMGDGSSEIEQKFAKLQNSQSHKAASMEELINREDRPKTFAELMGEDMIDELISGTDDNEEKAQPVVVITENEKEIREVKVTPKKRSSKEVTKTTGNGTKTSKEVKAVQQISLTDLFSDIQIPVYNTELKDDAPTKKGKKVTKISGQMSLADIFAA